MPVYGLESPYKIVYALRRREKRQWDGNPSMNESRLTLAGVVGLLPPLRGGHYVIVVTSHDWVNFDCPIFPQGLKSPYVHTTLDGRLIITGWNIRGNTSSMCLVEIEHTTACEIRVDHRLTKAHLATFSPPNKFISGFQKSVVIS